MDNTKGSRNNKRLSFRYEKHCTNVGRLANATLHHYSKSSKHSRNSLRGWLACIVLRLRTLADMSSRVAVWEFQHKYANTENVLKTRKRLQWLGFPAHAVLVFKILDCVHWEFQWVTAIHEKLHETRWCFEVWNGNSSCFASVCRILSISLGVPMQLREFSEHSRNSP